MIKPIYIFFGFLDSGKTKAIKETLYDGRFNEGEKSLIICFEKGDEEYDDKFLKYTNSDVVYLDFKDFSLDKQKELDNLYKPERIVIEFNGMDSVEDFFKQGFIKSWEIAQTLCTVDASTFKLFITNMKQFMYNHIKFSEVAVVNRIEGQDLRFLRNNLKGINQRVEIIFEDKDGNVTNKLNEDLFDTSKPLIISDTDYGLWYMDAIDNSLKYEGCQIEINAYYYEQVKEYENLGIFGRKAMVCCSDDIQAVAFSVVDTSGKNLPLMQKGKFYHLIGKIHCLDDEEGFKTCVIYLDSYAEADEPSDPLVYFN